MKSFAICMLVGASAAMKINRLRDVQVGETVLWQDEFVQTGAGDYSHDWESNSTITPYNTRDHAWNDNEFDMSDEVVWHNETREVHDGNSYGFNITLDGTVANTYTFNNQGWPSYVNRDSSKDAFDDTYWNLVGSP